MLAVKAQVVVNVSASCCRVGGLLCLLLNVSGETHLEVAQSTAGHKALQLLSGQKKRIALRHIQTFLAIINTISCRVTRKLGCCWFVKSIFKARKTL